jgi:DNA-binding transcriptional LysR family regulator
MNTGLLEHYRVFVAIARAGSLTAAADVLGAGQPTVSRQLAALESHLGCRLLQRSTRFMSLTEKGRALLPHAEALVAAGEVALQAVKDHAPGLTGRLRVSCSNAVGRRVILPSLRAWQERHPLLELDLILSDALEPVVRKGIDVALRLGTPPPSNLVATRIGTSRSAAYASADYIARHGEPAHPADLAQHACITYAGVPSSGRWTFVDRAGREHTVPVAGRLSLSSVDALQDAVMNGLGIALMPAWFWRDTAPKAQAVRLFPGLQTPPRPLVAMAGVRHGPRSKVAAFVAFFRDVWRTFDHEA